MPSWTSSSNAPRFGHSAQSLREAATDVTTLSPAASNGEVEGPPRSEQCAPRAHTVFPRPRRLTTYRSRTPPTIVRGPCVHQLRAPNGYVPHVGFARATHGVCSGPELVSAKANYSYLKGKTLDRADALSTNASGTAENVVAVALPKHSQVLQVISAAPNRAERKHKSCGAIGA